MTQKREKHFVRERKEERIREKHREEHVVVIWFRMESAAPILIQLV
jgi:hypothetical protein